MRYGVGGKKVDCMVAAGAVNSLNQREQKEKYIVLRRSKKRNDSPPPSSRIQHITEEKKLRNVLLPSREDKRPDANYKTRPEI